MRHAFLTAVLLLSVASAALAQLPVQPSSYIVRFYLAATGGSPVASTLLPASAYTCGHAPGSPLPVARYVASWHDPADERTWDNNPATVPNDCRYPDPGSGGFVSSPPNLTVYVTIAGGVLIEGAIAYGPESEPRLAFTNRVLPNGVPGFRVTPGGVAVIAGAIDGIIPNWATPNQPTWRLVNFSSVFGPFQMMVGTPDGVVRLPDYGAVQVGDAYELTLARRPNP